MPTSYPHNASRWSELLPELLSAIALEVSAVDFNAKSIIPLTLVCKHWHGSLVSTATHWTKISGRSEKLAALSLRRSGAALLTMRFNMEEIEPEFSELITPHVGRIKDLVLRNLTTTDDLFQKFPGFPQSMPSLKKLELKLLDRSDHWENRVDPFQSLPSALKYLLLERIPLYPSFLKLRNLTYFKFKDLQFHHHIDKLFKFLKGNRLLETVDLDIDIENPNFRTPSLPGQVNNLKLSYLSVSSKDPGVVRTLISKIRTPSRGSLHITPRNPSISFGQILFHAPTKEFVEKLSPDRMTFHFGSFLELSGQNGIFRFRGPPNPPMNLADIPLSSFKKIRELYLWIGHPSMLDPSRFPALEVLFICEGKLSAVLSPFFLSPESSPMLKTITIKDCQLSTDFMDKLLQFVKHKKTAGTPLSCIEIVHKAPGADDPFHKKLRQLGKHVQVVHKNMRYW